MFKNKLFKIFYFFIIPICIVVLIVSYFALKQLVFPSDLLLEDGRLFSEYARQKREELLKNGNAKLVDFRTKDGIKLYGLFIKRNNAIGNVLLCHGYQSCKETMIDYINMFPEYNLLMFDFRAHGQSEGKFRTLGCNEYKDVIAASEFLREQTCQGEFVPRQFPQIILGFSMGGASALAAVGVEPHICDLLILDSVFSNLKDVIYYAFTLKSGLPYYPFLPFIEKIVNIWANCDIAKMRPIESLKTFTKPILFIHSCVDEVVSPNDSLKMYASALSEKTKLWIAPKCEHGKLRKVFEQRYKKKVSKFIRTSLT